MSRPFRILASTAAFFGAWLLAFLLTLAVLPEALAWLQPILALAFAIWVTHRVWQGLDVATDGSLAIHVGMGAAIVGGLGFVPGFFGPMIFAPEANQGPLPGIFITGPGGGMAGAITGWLVWLKRRG
ncbi:MAG: multidrug ABC transporter permease [Thiobacillus sp.]